MTTPTPTDAEIRARVSQSYGNRVRPVLESAGTIPLVSNAACCGETAAASDDTATASAGCCGSASDSSCAPADATEDLQITNIARLYQDTDVSDLPATVTDVAFGCGNPPPSPP
jgi:hypothetical protein